MITRGELVTHVSALRRRELKKVLGIQNLDLHHVKHGVLGERGRVTEGESEGEQMGQPSGGWSKSKGDEKKRQCALERELKRCVCLGVYGRETGGGGGVYATHI